MGKPRNEVDRLENLILRAGHMHDDVRRAVTDDDLKSAAITVMADLIFGLARIAKGPRQSWRFDDAVARFDELQYVFDQMKRRKK